MGLFDVGENNVGQFGADNTNIIRYKQAAEYAEDARLYAIQAAEAIVDADNLLNRAEEILQEARDILDSVKDVETDVDALEARVTVAEAIANDAIAKAQLAIEQTAGILAAARGYADAAQNSAQSAQGFSQSAAQYAAAADSAATQAQGFRDEADGFADEAETHVTEAEAAVTSAETQANRAKTEADRAAEIVAGIPGKETIDGFAKLYKNKADAEADVADRTIGDKVLVWDEGTSVYTWYDITGTLENKELTLNSTEKRLKSVNNIQPDVDGNVQITLPSGNPSLWLGETVFFQYDPDQGITYPGLLPQNGNEYDRVDYPDLWATIEQNLIPSVSEAEWQAGKSNCFSTGNGTTTFRVPKWSGEAIRTPNANDEKGKTSSQIPYVVSVNGALPNDTTGNVVVDLSSYAKTTDMTLAINNATANKANKGANTDITSLSGLTTALSISQGGTGAKTLADAKTVFGIGSSSIPYFAGLELSGDTPFIDFHYNNTTSDYSARIINTEASALEVSANSGPVSLRVNGGIRAGGRTFSGGINVYRGNGVDDAVWGLNCSDGDFNFIRGGSAGGAINFGDSVFRNVRGFTSKQGTGGAYGPNTYSFFWNTSAQLEAWVDNSKVGNVSLSSTSDKGLKKDIKYREDDIKALEEVVQWRPADFKMKARGIIPETGDMLGFIANDLASISPECVSGKGLPEDYDIEKDPNNPDAYYLNQVPMIAKLTQAIQAQQKVIEENSKTIKAMESRLQTLEEIAAQR